MNGFLDFFHDRQAAGGFSTEDALGSFLPLARQVVETHLRGEVGPLAGLDALHVDEGRIWFADDQALPPRNNLEAVRRLQQPAAHAVEIRGESRRTTDADEGREQFVDLSVIRLLKHVLQSAVGHFLGGEKRASRMRREAKIAVCF
jgi:hypothetical protein